MESICKVHRSESLSLFCLECESVVCHQCLDNSEHRQHEIKPIAVVSKWKKRELSQNLHQLSEKATSVATLIQRLKAMSDEVTESCNKLEQLVIAQCDALTRLIKDRQQHLLQTIQTDTQSKLGALKEQQQHCTIKLQQTNNLIKFCIEALKESDSIAFLQICSTLTDRVTAANAQWHEDENTAPRILSVTNLTLDDARVKQAINNLCFADAVPPSPPSIVHENCLAENNSITIVWATSSHARIDGYVLELDDGNGGKFREVYRGNGTICTAEGLHFRSAYCARVKAFNDAGESDYSEIIRLRTADVATFAFDSSLSDGIGVNFTNNNSTVSVDGWNHRVILASVGFSRGVHYWECVVDKFSGDTDVAIGIARIDVIRDKMLGNDDKGFAMYIDDKRSWFQHNSKHKQRIDGGISNGSTVGVLLDLDQRTLRFLVDGQPQGSIAFRDLHGVFYPAVSINRGIILTLCTGIACRREHALS